MVSPVLAHSRISQVIDVKIIRQRPSGQHAGYGFVEFGNQFEAQHMLNACNGMPIPQHPQGACNLSASPDSGLKSTQPFFISYLNTACLLLTFSVESV